MNQSLADRLLQVAGQTFTLTQVVRPKPQRLGDSPLQLSSNESVILEEGTSNSTKSLDDNCSALPLMATLKP